MSFDERAAVRRTPTSLRVFHELSGVGIANVMVISVLERRPEIGLRRAELLTQACLVRRAHRTGLWEAAVYAWTARKAS
jgi:LPS sulfotransferase NodH